MAKDFFGYVRDVSANGAVLTSEFATINLGGGIVRLVQNVNAQYRQNVISRFEAGSPSLYWITGQAQGTIQMGRLLGRDGWFAGFSTFEDSCGELKSLTIGLDGNSGCAAIAPASGSATLKFADAVPEQVSASFNANGLEVNESITIRAATMSKA
jgi:hypothetical protein